MSLSSILNSWYPLARSIDLKKGKTSTLDLLGHQLVLFRTLDNRIGVLSRRCPHMGGDLSRGQVTQAGLACPIHQWEFSPEGHRIQPADNVETQGLTCQTSLPCTERWGLIFAFLGDEPYFELPQIEASVFSATPHVSDMDINYTVPSLFGFDMEHFRTVHHRDLTEMTIYRQQRGHIGTRLITAIGDSRWSDRLMHRLGINVVESDIDYWAGNIVSQECRVLSQFRTLDEHHHGLRATLRCQVALAPPCHRR